MVFCSLVLGKNIRRHIFYEITTLKITCKILPIDTTQGISILLGLFPLPPFASPWQLMIPSDERS